MSSCCSRLVTDWSVKLSIRSIRNCWCGSSLMAAYSLTNARGFSDMWSSVNSLTHCFRGLLISTSSLISSSPMTASWNKKSMTLPGLMLLTNVECSFWNLSFNTSFDSIDSYVHWVHWQKTVTASEYQNIWHSQHKIMQMCVRPLDLYVELAVITRRPDGVS